jgi:hypothetical protein
MIPAILASLALLLVLVPRPAAARWLDMPSICMVHTISTEPMTAAEQGMAALEQRHALQYRGSSAGCPFVAQDGVAKEVKEQLIEWALGLKAELPLQPAPARAEQGSTVRHSFIFKLSRKKVMVGFEMEW